MHPILSSDKDLKAESHCPHLCVKGHGCHHCPLLSATPPFPLVQPYTGSHEGRGQSMKLMLGLVLLGCYKAHFLVPCMQYVELRARHCTEVETARFPVSCWGNERWKQLWPCWLFTWWICAWSLPSEAPITPCIGAAVWEPSTDNSLQAAQDVCAT